MEWIKIKDNLPEFDKVVLLYEFRDGKHRINTGHLHSITSKGNLFITQESNPLGSIFGKEFNSNELVPTHWAKITIPK